MNTSLPLLNVITGSQAATGSRSGNPADSFTADVPFNQVLNSQVSSRNQENQSQEKPQATPAPAPAATNQAAQNDASAKPASATKTESKQEVADKSKEKDDEDDDTTTPASAELLALVANIAQNAVKPVTEGKSENTDADLLAQSKRGGATLSLADQHQAMMDDSKQGKIDLAGLQNSLAANKLKQEGSDLSRNVGATEANPVGQESGKSDKPALDLGADTSKAAPKEDASALSARAQAGKVAAEAAPTAKQDLPQTTPTPMAMPAMQQALATSQPQAVFATYTDKVQPNVGSAGWDQAVGSKITWMVSAGMQSASLSLNPPDLGPMQVVLNVHNQQADATFITAQPEVKQALEAAMPKLREMMDQAGIQLGQATVNTGMPNQQQGNTGQQQGRASSASGSFGKEQDGELAVNATTTTATSSGVGLVDTFA